jgi:hypothetical protein
MSLEEPFFSHTVSRMNGDLLRDGAKVQVVAYEFRRRKRISMRLILPAEGGADLVPGRVEPDQVTFALPMGIAGLEGAYTWQLRDHATGQIRTIVTWDMSNGVVTAAVRG